MTPYVRWAGQVSHTRRPAPEPIVPQYPTTDTEPVPLLIPNQYPYGGLPVATVPPSEQSGLSCLTVTVVRRIKPTTLRSEINRFWAKVDKQGPLPQHAPELGRCWVWTASKKKGYGQFTVNGKRVRAHRWSLAQALGRPVTGLVCHRCDNPPCVKPAHLYEGTLESNREDYYAKLRRGFRPVHGGSRLRPEQIPTIRQRYADGELLREIGANLGVSEVTIHHIVTRKTWAHIP